MRVEEKRFSSVRAAAAYRKLITPLCALQSDSFIWRGQMLGPPRGPPKTRRATQWATCIKGADTKARSPARGVVNTVFRNTTVQEKGEGLQALAQHQLLLERLR